MANNNTTIIIPHPTVILCQITSNKSTSTRYNCKIATNEANYMILVAFERSNSALSKDSQDLRFGEFDGKLH